MTHLLSFALAALLLSSQAFAASNQEKRDKIQKMRGEVLTKLYKEEADVKGQIAKAEGYAVFSNVGVNLIFFSAGGGSGVVHDNKSGKDTYMNMGTAGVGLGLGVKDFRAVFVFHERKAMDNFVDNGWDFSGQADAAAKSTDKGGEGSAAGSVLNGVSVYQLTETGLVLQATLQGTKYWKSDKLNNK
jgi:lipid-binding SYLF domain-containing protein